MNFVFEKSQIIKQIAPLVNSTDEYVVMSFLNGTWYISQPQSPTYSGSTSFESDSTMVITLSDIGEIVEFYSCLGRDVHVLAVDMDFIIEYNKRIRESDIEIITSSTSKRFAIIDKSLTDLALVMKLSLNNDIGDTNGI